MILVTVGTHSQGFNRLVQPMDELAATLEERVVIQYGASTHVPVHAEAFAFTSSGRMAELTGEARVIVMHAAAGSIILALTLQKPLVLVPRLQRFGEIFDDHQRQLAAALETQGRAVYVVEPSFSSLQTGLQKVETPHKTAGKATHLIEALHHEINQKR